MSSKKKTKIDYESMGFNFNNPDVSIDSKQNETEDPNTKSNIVSTNKTKEDISYYLNTIYNCLLKSFGPYGSTTIVMDPRHNHSITKDGYTILNKIMFNDELGLTILDIVKNTSKKLVRSVGDGTTSAIIFSKLLYDRLNSFINKFKIPTKDIIMILDKITKEFERLLLENKHEINDKNFEQIRKIAYISSNNNKEVGDLLVDVYKKIGINGNIDIEKTNKNQMYYSLNNGFEIGRGYIDKIFVNQTDRKTFDTEDDIVYVLMCSDELSVKDNDVYLLGNLINKICLIDKRSLIVVAKSYDSFIRDFFTSTKIQLDNLKDKSKVKFAAIDISLASKQSEDIFEDLAIYLNATVYNKKIPNNEFEIIKHFDPSKEINHMNYELFGTCKRVKINEMTTKFFSGQSDKSLVEKRTESINADIISLSNINDNLNRTHEIKKLYKRINNLQGNMATIYINGESELEQSTKEFLVEDSINACKSALKNGYGVGCCLNIPFILFKDSVDVKYDKPYIHDIIKNLPFIKKISLELDIDEEIVENIFTFCLLSLIDVYKSVLLNYTNNKEETTKLIERCLSDKLIYNLNRKVFEDDLTTDVISPIETDIQIIKSAFSIIGLLVTSNQFIKVTI